LLRNSSNQSTRKRRLIVLSWRYSRRLTKESINQSCHQANHVFCVIYKEINVMSASEITGESSSPYPVVNL